MPSFGRETAKFRVVIEGSGRATHSVSVDGTNGPCQITSRTESREEFEYFRGKGVTVLFTRFKGIPNSPIIMRRIGQRDFRPVFNVRGWYEDEASGQASRSGDANLCIPLTEKVGDERECNRKIHRPIDMALTLSGRKVVLEMADPELTRLPGAGCGSNSIETLSGWPLIGWGGFAELEPEPLRPGLIFGNKGGFVIRYEGTDENKVDSPNPAFTGRSLDRGEHNAVVRFIRIRP